MKDNDYFTFKTKAEIIALNQEKSASKNYVVETKTITKVSAPIIPHLAFIPDLRIQTANCNLYSGYNCVGSIGWQLQELFTLIDEKYHYVANDDGETLDWFTGKEIDVIAIDAFPRYIVLAIGNAEKDKWINLDTWAKEVVAKHIK